MRAAANPRTSSTKAKTTPPRLMTTTTRKKRTRRTPPSKSLSSLPSQFRLPTKLQRRRDRPSPTKKKTMKGLPPPSSKRTPIKTRIKPKQKQMGSRKCRKQRLERVAKKI